MSGATDWSFEQKVKDYTNWAIMLGIGSISLPFLLVGVLAVPTLAAWIVGWVLGLGCLTSMKRASGNKKLRDEYLGYAAHLNTLASGTDPRAIMDGLNWLEGETHPPYIAEMIARRRPAIENRLIQAKAELESRQDAEAQRRRLENLSIAISGMRRDTHARINRARDTHPLLAAREAALNRLHLVKRRRIQLEADIEETLKAASWWQTLTYDYPDFREMDRQIGRLESDMRVFVSTKRHAIHEAELRFDLADGMVDQRLDAIVKSVREAIPSSRHLPFKENEIAMNALFLGALSVPVSAWQDFVQADAVYAALRDVNGSYAGMSDFEIWMQCLTMPSESLAGLMALTKGALFETYVSDATGGVLHEHFNTPDTDIIIDGTAFQIKATDSEAYIRSVDPDIPVISTSEVAEATGAIDGEINNADLESATHLAMGGSIVDLSDTALDAALSAFGSLGILASLRGINHAIDRHRQGIDKAEAIEEGIAVAVSGSLKATVDLVEMGYKVVTSRPSRFVGHQAMKIADRVGRAIDESEERANRERNLKS